MPPPITGHAIASKVLLEHLQGQHSVEVVDLKEGSKHDGTVTLKRLFAVLKVILKVMISARRADRLYLTISESIAGNLKDLLIYIVIGKLNKNTVIHLHGGSFGRFILYRFPVLFRLNRFFVSKMTGVIVSGPSHSVFFCDLISAEKIHTIPNFAQGFMFAKLDDVETKFNKSDVKIRVLYISGMIAGKGYMKLLEAYEALNNSAKSRFQLDFAGKFDSEIDRDNFTNRIADQTDITYHGIISDKLKAKLFAEAHIFCLPTSFLEGQPISIIEAYASGCVVLSTPCPGVLDIFEPLKNGYLISPDDSTMIKEVLESKCLSLPELQVIAINNRCFADAHFREEFFCQKVENVLTQVKN
jgi:glycosyltransferase involved in cell wall biosynthesis